MPNTHLYEEIKEMYECYNITPSTIPGICKKFLQPLDATVINSFKRHSYRIENKLIEQPI